MPVDWSTATPEEIIAKYKELTGGDVDEDTENPTLPKGWYTAIEDYAKRTKAAGLPWNRDAYIRALGTKGISAEAAGKMYDRAADFYAVNQRWPGEEDVNQWLTELQPGLGQTPTLGRDELSERRRQFDVGFGEDKRQFDVSDARAKEQYWANLLAQMAGTPSSYRQYEKMLGQMGTSRTTPGLHAAFGNVSGVPGWSDLKLDDILNAAKGTPANTNPAQPPVQQPIVEQPVQTPVRQQPTTAYQDYIVWQRSLGRQPTESEWITFIAGKTGLTPNQAAWVRQQGYKSFAEGKGWPGKELFDQQVEYARQNIPAQVAAGGAGAPIPPTQPTATPTSPAGKVAAQPVTGIAQAPNPWEVTRDTGQSAGTPASPAVAQQQKQFYQPIQITPQMYANWTPTERAMRESEWKDSSLQVPDMWELMRRAQPKGTANTAIRWA